MKALLVEGVPDNRRSNLEQTFIVLLPTGEVDKYSDPFPSYFLMESDRIGFCLITYEELRDLKIRKEVELSEDVVNKFNEFTEAKEVLNQKYSELREALLKEKVDPNFDAMSFLSYGSTFFH